jgi:myosin-5
VNTVSARFKTQLGDLCHLLSSTGLHYVRCLKPNSEFSPTAYDRPKMADQLRSAGAPSAAGRPSSHRLISF